VGSGSSVVGFGALLPEGRSVDPHSSRHVRTLGKFFSHSCLWHFGMSTSTQNQCSSRERLVVVVDLERRYGNILNEGMNES